MLTILTNYGDISYDRQKDIIQDLKGNKKAIDRNVEELAQAIARELSNKIE